MFPMEPPLEYAPCRLDPSRFQSPSLMTTPRAVMSTHAIVTAALDELNFVSTYCDALASPYHRAYDTGLATTIKGGQQAPQLLRWLLRLPHSRRDIWRKHLALGDDRRSCLYPW